MIVSLCGLSGNNKNYFIEELKKCYTDKIIICNLFHIKFETIIENESIKYRLIDSCSTLTHAREAFSKYI